MSCADRIVWLRRDLRLHDHPALAAGGPDARVVVVREPAANGFQRALVDAALDEVRAHRTVEVFDGDPREVIPGLNPTKVWVSADFTPSGLARDRAVSGALGPGVMEAAGSAYAVDPGILRTGQGGHYKVFTPFYRAWCDYGADDPVGGLPGEDGLPVTRAWRDWCGFLRDRLDGYAENRDIPAIDGTSRISGWLAVGALHPRSLLATLAVADAPEDDKEAFARELAFREFYADFLHHRPETAHSDVNPRFAGFRWNESGSEFDLWARGRTGFPIVDAGMRQLAATGWMHNRVRMLVASFLTKDLHLPWQAGAEHFRRHLVDFDVASNQHSWQWCAGTGTDASPYFRVFNPMTQGRKFDPDSRYITRWVPELRGVPAGDIHAIRNLPSGYPVPIVDHAEERRDALARYEEISALRAP
ncbi:DNA photolyase family protein [Corynebacterium sp. P7202]|uniref:Deoxyribodipyrimidine photo-lyase n=1 Tax=Corynebacterium pygosceleis TaxID=2800406 RepID=A0A9Q4GLJ1_9CORY|nr:deoxyribodipyrimidine photo-lyase [Corynebacterium pygosceleis]MCK7637247.1 DNA photolyase family protein [Corynebacterium pygosceleis]MCX7445150.1 deoxyribodipyrimidine photo-lyase [Corynebacterium pygosceleis]MCX7468425.1 deoxyribodipyrimidine photo-lyase [Corynebacterium pygosceleis]